MNRDEQQTLPCTVGTLPSKMPASNHGPAIPAASLLPHVLDATAHAQRLHAAPAVVAELLQTAARAIYDAGQLDTARPLLNRALSISLVRPGT